MPHIKISDEKENKNSRDLHILRWKKTANIFMIKSKDEILLTKFSHAEDYFQWLTQIQ